MSIGRLYDNVAKHYQLADYFGAITETHKTFFEQFKLLEFTSTEPLHIADLGVGDGKLLGLIKQRYPDADMTGLDRSEEMLKLASQQTRMHTVAGNIKQAPELLKHEYFNLLIGHFILAFIDLNQLLNIAQTLLAPKGAISIASSSFESFPHARATIEKYTQNNPFLGRFVRKHYERATKATQTPENKDYYYSTAKQNGFEIIDFKTIIIKYECPNIHVAFDVAFKAGWLPFSLNYKHLPTWLVNSMCKQMLRQMLKFPFEDVQYINIAMLQKV